MEGCNTLNTPLTKTPNSVCFSMTKSRPTSTHITCTAPLSLVSRTSRGSRVLTCLFQYRHSLAKCTVLVNAMFNTGSVFSYLAGTRQRGLFFDAGKPVFAGSLQFSSSCLHAAVGTDWGEDHETRRYTIGFIIAINTAPILWRSNRQTLVTFSSGESEYVTLSTCGREVSWLRKLFFEMVYLRIRSSEARFKSTIIKVDSGAAICKAGRDDTNVRTEHEDPN